MTLGDTQRELEQVIADLRQIGEITIKNVWPIAKKVVNAVKRVISIASEPPPPDPTTVRDVASRWREMAPAMGEWHANDVQSARNTIPETVWGRSPGDPSGETTGDKARTNIDHFKTKSTTIGPAGTAVATSLGTFGESMEKARDRWSNAFKSLKDDVGWDKIPLNPLDAPEYVAKLVGDVIHGVQELAGAYGDADKAVGTAKGDVGKALEGIALPDHTSGAAGAIGSVNQWTDTKGDADGHKDGTGLRPGVLERADAALAGMSPEDRAKAQALLDNAKDENRRNWIAAAIARGADVDALQRFSDKLNSMSDEQVRQLDPTVNPSSYVQPDGTTCGSSSLVVAKMINDPMYAMQVFTGYDPETGRQAMGGNDPDAVKARFGDEAKKMHDLTNDAVGGWGTNWPKWLGTPPWGAADEMGAPDGAGVPGSSYDWTLHPQAGAASDYQSITTAVQKGQVVPLFIGTGPYPSHVILVIGMQGNDLQIYDSAVGEVSTISKDKFINGNFELTWSGGWNVWGSVTPK